MKKLQNNFTTPEQSKRLLELGVPVWTADGLQTYRGIRVLAEPQSNNPSPCWSVGRLIEIFIICTPYVEIRLRTRIVERLIESFFDVKKQGLIDFLKLNE